LPCFYEVKKGDEVLKLRDDNGFPVWSGWRRRQFRDTAVQTMAVVAVGGEWFDPETFAAAGLSPISTLASSPWPALYSSVD
jgi:hypothetical protein